MYSGPPGQYSMVDVVLLDVVDVVDVLVLEIVEVLVVVLEELDVVVVELAEVVVVVVVDVVDVVAVVVVVEVVVVVVDVVSGISTASAQHRTPKAAAVGWHTGRLPILGPLELPNAARRPVPCTPGRVHVALVQTYALSRLQPV